MAFIPDEAIDRLHELSKGARHLYVFLARCRNQRTGRCHPSVSATMAALACNRGTVYALRTELSGAGWAQFEGDSATCLLGFNSLNNQTIGEANKQDTGISLNNQTENTGSLNNQTIGEVNKQDTGISLNNQTDAEESEKSDKIQPASLIIQTTCLNNQTKKSDYSDSHIRKNQQREPAKEPEEEYILLQASPSGGNAPEKPAGLIAPAPATAAAEPVTAQHPAVQAVRQVLNRYPNRATFPAIAEALGGVPDTPRLRECFVEWCKRGFNPLNLAWLFQWYACGIPPDTRASPALAHRNGAARFATRNTAQNEAAMDEAIRRMEVRRNAG